MSTKTTFKRIALVAVAALGLGVLTSVAPATAAANTNFNCTTAYTTGAANTTDPDAACTSVAGPANFVTVTATTLSVYVVLTGGTFTDGTTTKTITTTANIATPTVGTITAAGYPITNGVASSTAQTVTVTVGATANKGLVNAATSTSLLKSGTSWASITADETVYAARTNAAVAGVSKVVLAGANGAITSTTAVTATISGPGSLQLVGSDESTVIASGRAVSSTFGTTTA